MINPIFYGKLFYALVSRAGGKFKDIHKLVLYRIRDDGVPKKMHDVYQCVANKAQKRAVFELTKDCGHVYGKPSKAKLSALSDRDLLKLTATLLPITDKD